MEQDRQKNTEPKYPTPGRLCVHDGSQRNAVHQGMHAKSKQQAEPRKGAVWSGCVTVLMGVVVGVSIRVAMLAVSSSKSKIVLVKMKQPK